MITDIVNILHQQTIPSIQYVIYHYTCKYIFKLALIYFIFKNNCPLCYSQDLRKDKREFHCTHLEMNKTFYSDELDLI